MAELKKSILVVDDETVSRTFLKHILSEAGYDVTEASDGIQAFEMIQRKVPDLLITDRAMPGLGGLELLKKLANKDFEIKSIVVSAYGEESFWSKAIALGAQDYLMKPFHAEDVLKVVRKVFGGKTK